MLKCKLSKKFEREVHVSKVLNVIQLKWLWDLSRVKSVIYVKVNFNHLVFKYTAWLINKRAYTY